MLCFPRWWRQAARLATLDVMKAARIVWHAGLLLCSLLTGCAGTQFRAVPMSGHRFDPEKYFEGRTQSWGVIEDRFGNVRRQFTAKLVGKRQGPVLHLDQTFTFADGETQRRVWRIRRLDEHRLEGTASDVVGVARGELHRNVLVWNYTLAVPLGRGKTNIRFTQHMLLQDDGVLFNRVKFSKFGVRLGRVSEFFQKEGD